MQQLPAKRQQELAPAIGQETEETDADEGMWKHMKKKAPQELLRCEGHEFLFAAMRIILPAESDLAIRKGNNPMVGDGHTMCIAGQVMQNVLRTAERRFRVHDPVLAKERTKKGTKGTLLCKWSKGAPDPASGRDQPQRKGIEAAQGVVQTPCRLGGHFECRHTFGQRAKYRLSL